jgi:hypothetical protein
MIDVEMSDDIRKYETKTFGPFTTRQIACIGIGAAFAIPVGMLLPIEDISNRILVIAVLLMPFILCGYVKMDGTNFEVIALRWLYLYVLTPAKRKLVQPNVYKEKVAADKAKDEQIKLSKLPDKERRAYLNAKKKKIVQYSQRKEFKIYR